MNVRNVLPRDAIPSVDDPTFGERYDGDADDELIVLDGDPPRAYPVRYLHFHEVVNDEVPGISTIGADESPDPLPVAVTWCPLCGSAVAYSRLIEDLPEPVEFGVSGKLADDDLVLYDRTTESEWKQSTGEAIAGELDGASLDPVPITMLTAAEFRQTLPDGLVMQPPGGESEAAGPGPETAPIDYDDEPYREYFERDGFGLDAHRDGDGRDWDRDDLDPKTVVLGIERNGEAVGIPLPRLEAAGGVVQVRVGGTRCIVVATEGGLFAYEHPRRNDATARGASQDATTESGQSDPSDTLEDDTVDPIPDESGGFYADGTVWNGRTGESEDGRQLSRVPIRRLFAFAWQDDHGPDAFWKSS